jgi:hypothetical protein
VSLRADGFYRCDRCGLDLGNASVLVAAKIVDLDPDDPTTQRNYDLCREPRDGAPRGCTGNVLGPGTLADYYAEG